MDEKTEGTSGDNEYLIRGVGFGNGLFVAARGFPGGSVRVSHDGANWTSHEAPTDQWMAAVAYVGSTYVAAGSNLAWTSRDGRTWSAQSVFPSAARAMAQSQSALLVALSNGEWWRSADAGETWSLDSQGHTASNEVKVADCGGSFREVGDGDYRGLPACAGFARTRGAVHAEGTWLRAASGGIERSTDGSSWTKVYSRSGVEDIDIGYVVY